MCSSQDSAGGAEVMLCLSDNLKVQCKAQKSQRDRTLLSQVNVLFVVEKCLYAEI